MPRFDPLQVDKRPLICQMKMSMLISSLAFLLPFGVYVYTLAPDITWAYFGGDGGDLMTAAYRLGVPHPSGYPTYVLVGWLFSKMPIGAIAWRFNLLSALSMAGGGWILFNILYHLTASMIPALVGAWTFTFMPLVWSQAIITEVYGLNFFFVAGLTWLALQVYSGQDGWLILLGLGFGLALGVHLTIVFLGPILWCCCRPAMMTKRSLTMGLLGFFLGLSIFAYLPLRATLGPITWGRPDTWSGFWALVLGQIYQGYLFSISLDLLGQRLIILGRYLAQLQLIGLFLCGLGVYWCWHQAGQALFWASLSIFLYLIYALGYNTADSYVYLIPVFAFVAVAISLGAREICEQISLGFYRYLGQGLLCLLPLYLLVFNLLAFSLFPADVSNPKRISLQEDHEAAQFWQVVFDQAPAQALILSELDRHTFTLWYAHHVLGQRPDIAIIDTRLVAYAWHQENLYQNYPYLRRMNHLDNISQSNIAIPWPVCRIVETIEETVEETIEYLQRQTKTWQVICVHH